MNLEETAKELIRRKLKEGGEAAHIVSVGLAPRQRHTRYNVYVVTTYSKTGPIDVKVWEVQFADDECGYTGQGGYAIVATMVGDNLEYEPFYYDLVLREEETERKSARG